MRSRVIMVAALVMASYATAMPCFALVEQITPVALEKALSSRRKPVVVDVRASEQYAYEHIAGAVNVPVALVGFHKFAPKDAIVLYCSGVGCALSETAANTLTAKGHKNVKVLAGGIDAWKKSGYAVVASEAQPAPARRQAVVAGKITAAETEVLLARNELLLLDVRPETEYGAGHIKGAINVPGEELAEKTAALAGGKKIVVYGKSAGGGKAAAEKLTAKGLPVYELQGGLLLWVAEGRAVVAGN